METKTIRRSKRRQIGIAMRDTLLLLREFRAPLLIFLTTILGGGIGYYLIAARVGEPVENLAEAVYIVLTLAFLQPSRDFPHHPVLEMYYFLTPLIGIGTLALGLADFGILLFNRQARSKEWEMAIASTLNKHHVLVGLGHLGFNIVQTLKGMNQQIAVIELNPSADLTTAVQNMDVPIIHDDASREPALEAAGIRRAASIILCIQNDALNLKIALKARNLNPDIRVVVRIFDEDFAQALSEQFHFIALSSTAMAAPAFASSAAGSDITRPISVEGEAFSLARISITPGSLLEGKTVEQIEGQYVVSTILVRSNDQSVFHPTGSHSIRARDMVVVIGHPQRLHKLIHDSQ